MRPLIPMNEFGMLADAHGTALVDSLFVAAIFEKAHRHVLRDIGKITEPKSGLSETFVRTNFKKGCYRDRTGRMLTKYLLTRDEFTLLVMGYSGTKAMQFKEKYIQQFNEMEQCILALGNAKHEFPLLAEMIAKIYGEPKPYHFSNECDMLNRIVLGMTAKQYRIVHAIPKGQSIRPYLSYEQLYALDMLQRIDLGLLLSCLTFKERKEKLQAYYATLGGVNHVLR